MEKTTFSCDLCEEPIALVSDGDGDDILPAVLVWQPVTTTQAGTSSETLHVCRACTLKLKKAFPKQKLRFR